MSLLSPQANLFQLLIAKLITDVPELRYIDQDLGQLENYEMRPAVAWPCGLIDIEEFKYTDQLNFLAQVAEGIISIRLGMVKYTDSNNLTPANIRENALQYYEIEHKVYKALHGWNPTGFGKLLRRASGTERREDDIRVRIVKFAISFTDDSSKKVMTTVARPGAVVGSKGLGNG